MSPNQHANSSAFSVPLIVDNRPPPQPVEAHDNARNSVEEFLHGQVSPSAGNEPVNGSHQVQSVMAGDTTQITTEEIKWLPYREFESRIMNKRSEEQNVLRFLRRELQRPDICVYKREMNIRMAQMALAKSELVSAANLSRVIVQTREVNINNHGPPRNPLLLSDDELMGLGLIEFYRGMKYLNASRDQVSALRQYRRALRDKNYEKKIAEKKEKEVPNHKVKQEPTIPKSSKISMELILCIFICVLLITDILSNIFFAS